MKKEKKDGKKASKKDTKKDTKSLIKRGGKESSKRNDKSKKRKKDDEQDFESELDQNDSLSNIYDSQEDDFTQSLQSKQDKDSQIEEEQGQNDQSFDEIEKQIKQQLSEIQSQKGQTQNENTYSQRQKKQNSKQIDDRRRKLDQLQKARFERYLSKSSNSLALNNNQEKSDAKVKVQGNDQLSVAPQASERDNDLRQQSQFESAITTTSAIKTDNSDLKSNISVSQSQDPQLISYLIKILNGTVTVEDIEKRNKQQSIKQKLEAKIKQMKKRKIQGDSIKKEFDQRSQSQMKVLSTNMDSNYNKYQTQSFHMDRKSQISRIKTQEIENNEEAQQGRKKRTRVTPEMLKQIIKDFEYMAKQQNGMIPDSLRVTFKDIGKKYMLGRSSIMKMYSDYCKDPTMKSRFQTKQPMSHNRSMMQLTKRRITFVEKLIRKDCTLSQRQIAAEMNMHDDLKCKRKKRPDQTSQEYLNDPYHIIAYKAVSRLMKLGNFTRKKVTLIPKNRNSERTIEQRFNFCKILNELIASPNNKLYFLDQCRFNLFTSRDWGWAPRGQLATKVRHNSKGKDVMLLAIIGKQGLIGHEISDSYNRGSFTIAVNKLINSIIPQTVPQGQRIYLILDNCPIHNKDNLKNLELTLPLTILYLPPYSPMLNPIESWFGQLKRVVKSKIYKTRQAMKAELVRVLQTFKNKSLQNYYRGIQKYIALGLKKQLYRGNNKF